MTGPEETSDNPLLVVRGAVAELLLNAPARKNSLSLAAWTKIPDLLTQAAGISGVRMLVVKGAGGEAFCAGADISEFEEVRATATAASHYDAVNVAAFKALKTFPMPVLAAIEGPCLGGGLGLALACDIRIADDTAVFGIPAARLGLAYPPEALGDLLEAVSLSDAKRLLFMAERHRAPSALEMGLVGELVARGQLDARVAAICKSVCSNAPLTLKAAKHALNRLAEPTLDAENHAQATRNADACINSRDYAEGCRAFLEKRAPVFDGH